MSYITRQYGPEQWNQWVKLEPYEVHSMQEWQDMVKDLRARFDATYHMHGMEPVRQMARFMNMSPPPSLPDLLDPDLDLRNICTNARYSGQHVSPSVRNGQWQLMYGHSPVLGVDIVFFTTSIKLDQSKLTPF